jgi:hypothetical protein
LPTVERVEQQWTMMMNMTMMMMHRYCNKSGQSRQTNPDEVKARG